MKFLRNTIKWIRARLPVWIALAKNVALKEGIPGIVKRVKTRVNRLVKAGRDPHKLQNLQYGQWMNEVESTYLNDQHMKSIDSGLKLRPKFSIILPIWNKDKRLLEKALDSVLDQFYNNWELCVSEGSSEKYRAETEELLKRYTGKFGDKIKIRYLENNLRENINIIINSNNALDQATGEYCVFMDCDDELSRNCLLELASAIQNDSDVDFLYSDYDHKMLDGKRHDPRFLPDWSPHTSLAQIYTTHVTCYRRSLLNDLGGLRAGTEGCQDWDLILRLSELTDKITHIPKILYHWRIYPGSTALSSGGAKDWAYENQKKMYEDWFKRNNIKGHVEEGVYQGLWRVRYEILGNPKVSIVIPFKDKVKMLKRCVSSIERYTEYKNYEIVLVDNQSREKSTLDYLEFVKDKYRVLRYDKPYHFGDINNWAAEKVSGVHLVFLNNDTEVRESGWLSAMLEYSQQEDIGAVGAKLYYPDGKIQHAGIIVGLCGSAAHSHRLVDGKSLGYMGWLVSVRDVMAVTAACMMIKRKLFLAIGGFDSQFNPGFQDVDFCIRLYEKGYWNIYTSYSRLDHFESATRMSNSNKKILISDEKMAEKLRRKWSKYIGLDYCRDPFYNLNLSPCHEDFRLDVTQD